MHWLAPLCPAALLLLAPAVHAEGPGDDPLEVRVLVLNFDPLVPSHGDRPLHEVLGWSDPRRLSDAYFADIASTSGGFVEYTLAMWRDIDGFPVKTDNAEAARRLRHAFAAVRQSLLLPCRPSTFCIANS